MCMCGVGLAGNKHTAQDVETVEGIGPKGECMGK